MCLRGAEAVRTVVFFGLAFAYVWLWVRPVLIYGCATITNFPVFYRGWSFLRETVGHPGGVVQYLSAFASQLFYYSWAGAAVIVLQAWATSACTGYLLRAVRLPGARLLRFVPAILVVAAYARYSYHLPLFTGALAALAFACLYVRLASGSSDSIGRAAVAYLILATALYLVGAAAVLPFAVLCAAYELDHRRWIRIGLCLLVGLVLPYVLGVLAFGVSIENAYTDLLPVSWRVYGWPTRERMVATVYGVYLLPLLALAAAGLWHAFAGGRKPEVPTEKPAAKPAKGRHPTSGKPSRGLLARPAVGWTLGTLVLFAVGGAAAMFSLDPREKALLEVHRYACRRMWPEVLAAARGCPDSAYALNAIDRALYYTGRLDSDLCLYVQRPENLLITGNDHVVRYWHTFDTLMDLGLLNLAEKNLTECLETFGEHPLILERLAMVNLVKGRIGAARIYLGALQKTLFHSRWASDWLSRLDADPNLAGDPEIQRLRAQAVRVDSIGAFYDAESMLTALVEQSRVAGPQPQGLAPATPNRMAFEYLTAWYLLNGQLGRIVQQIGRLDEFGYTDIPPLCQQAILIYAYGAGKSVDLYGRAINPETKQRFMDFNRIVKKYGANKAAAIPELARDYRGSYFFYYYCTHVATRR